MSPSAVKSAMPQVEQSVGAQHILELLKNAGGVIIKGLLSKEEVAVMNKELDAPLQKLQPGSAHESELIKEFHGTNTKRLTGLTADSKAFRDCLLDNDLCHDIAERVFHPHLGTYWLTTAQVIEIGPGNVAQQLHRDQSQFQVFDAMGPDGPEVAINFLVALTDFTEANGATRVLPGSHKWPDFSTVASPEDTVAGEMEPGDVLLISGKTIHGGGANKTESEYRRGISFAFQASFLTPEEAYPHITPRAVVERLSLRAQRMIGFRSQYPKYCPGLWQANASEIGDQIGFPGVEDVIEKIKIGHM